MNYQVLARKWRPQTFQEMVGQQHVLRALINALDNNRLHHAYLFTGTRGVGKTTVARILAKCLNCEQGISSKPCGTCSACQEITQGRFVDLIEVDAASRTKVEDTRDLLENVQYAPNRGRFKVYLIDEVHMLSGHSFNALLKTLEEPPPHVKFLLATTDPQRLPVTVLSRCLQFHLKNMPPEMIADYLGGVLEKENIPFEQPGLWQLSCAADGSMRDALSLLDQAIAYGNGNIIASEIHAMLGTLPTQQITPLLEALASANAQQLISIINDLAGHGANFHQVLEDLLSILQQIALAQVAPEAIDQHHTARDTILVLAKQISAEDVQLYYQIGLMGRRDLPLAPHPKMGFEMILLRMLVFRPGNGEFAGQTHGSVTTANTQTPHSATAIRSTVNTLSSTNNQTSIPSNTTTSSQTINHAAIKSNAATAMHNHNSIILDAAPSSASTIKIVPEIKITSEIKSTTEIKTAPEIKMPAEFKAITEITAIPDNEWSRLLSQINLTGITHALANNCALEKMDEHGIYLALDPSHAALHNARHEERLLTALQQHLNKPIKLHIRIGTPNAQTPAQHQQLISQAAQQVAKKALEADKGVQQLLKTFDAKIQPDSIQPIAQVVEENS